MANEIKVGLSLTVSKGNAGTQKAESASIDMAGDNYSQGAVSLSTTTSLDLMTLCQSITNPGWVFIKMIACDTPATTYVKHGYETAPVGGKLYLGESCLLRAPNSVTNYFLKASASDNVKCEYIIVEP